MPLAGVEIKYDSNGAVARTNRYYLHSDHLNAPRMATNQGRTLQWTWNSDAFGVGLPNADVDGDGVSLDIPLRSPGQQHDGHSALNYNYFRDYDPDKGRYVQSDPIGLRGGLNTYGYVYASPLRYSDPNGLVPVAAAGSCFVPGVGWVSCAAVAVGIGGAGLACYLSGACENFAKACSDAWTAMSESSPVISPDEIAGKTPEEIDQTAKEKGLIPKGDPMSGKGSYVGPVTGEQRVLCHVNCDSPHAHVNNPNGDRLDINGNVVSPESPDAHLPINY